MPQSAYRQFVGIAKDLLNSNLSIAVAASGTTLTLKNITSGCSAVVAAGSTYTAVIVDGPLTESTVLTGNLSGTTDGATVACTALTNAHTANAYVYFQLTASIGPTAYISLTKFDAKETYVQLYDKGYRGSQAAIFGAQQGTRVSDLSLDGDFFPDTAGYLLSSLMGAYDYTATTGVNPTTYAFSPLNTGNGQPNSILIYWYNPSASNTRVFAQAKVSDMTIKLNPGALVGHTTSIKAFASGIVANPSTIPPTFSSVTPTPARVSTVSIGGTITGKCEMAEYAFKRENFAEIYTLNAVQDPLAIFSGPLSLTTKFALVADDDAQFLNYVNQSQPSFTVTANIGATTAANGVKIQCTKANYEAVQYIPKGAYMEVTGSFVALANSTDKSTAGGGLSPALVTLSTGTTTGSTLY